MCEDKRVDEVVSAEGSPAADPVNERPTIEELTAILTDPDVLAGKHLPQAEQDEHRRCLESIVEARRAAPGNEGQILIGAALAADCEPKAEGERPA